MLKTNRITARQVEIIEAAAKILTKSGVGGLTIKNLAKEMHFSEGAVYRHFSGKEQIIMLMLEYLTNELDHRYQDAVASLSDPKERFIALFKNQIQFFGENPHFAVVAFSDGLMEESNQINNKILNIMSVEIKHLMPILVDGQYTNQFTTRLEADELSHVTMAAIRLLMVKWRASDFKFDLAKHGDKMIQSLLKLITCH